jgi:hypothetical protein
VSAGEGLRGFVFGFDLWCSRSSTKDLADDDDVDFLHSEDANVRDMSCGMAGRRCGNM